MAAQSAAAGRGRIARTRIIVLLFSEKNIGQWETWFRFSTFHSLSSPEAVGTWECAASVPPVWRGRKAVSQDP
jgi:hypothetical protein